MTAEKIQNILKKRQAEAAEKEAEDKIINDHEQQLTREKRVATQNHIIQKEADRERTRTTMAEAAEKAMLPQAPPPPAPHSTSGKWKIMQDGMLVINNAYVEFKRDQIIEEVNEKYLIDACVFNKFPIVPVGNFTTSHCPSCGIDLQTSEDSTVT